MTKILLGSLIIFPVAIEIFFQSTSRLIIGVITIKGIDFGHKYILVILQSAVLLASSIWGFILRKQFKHRGIYYFLLVFLLLWAVVAFLGYDLALNGKVEVRGF